VAVEARDGRVVAKAPNDRQAGGADRVSKHLTNP
jgi:hypothetical protein